MTGQKERLKKRAQEAERLVEERDEETADILAETARKGNLRNSLRCSLFRVGILWSPPLSDLG